MRIGIDNALGAMPAALALRAQRTTMLANNIANADTPGFKARDIDFAGILAAQSGGQAQGAPLARTDGQHLQPGAASTASAGELHYRVPLMPSLDGNTVDTQLEQAEFSKNSMQFLATLRLLNGRLQGMTTAIKGE